MNPPECLVVIEWARFQHYKDRDPPWIKLYRDIMTSEAWVLGNDLSRLAQVAITLLAARYQNRTPYRFDLIKKVTSLDCSEVQFRRAVTHLQQSHFLEVHVEQVNSTVLAEGYQNARLGEERREEERREEGGTPSHLEQNASAVLAIAPAVHSPKRKHPTKIPLPEDFELTPELEQYAADRLPHVDASGLMESFRGKALAKGWEYANWRQAFQEFVRNAAPKSGHFAAGQYPKKGANGMTWEG